MKLPAARTQKVVFVWLGVPHPEYIPDRHLLFPCVLPFLLCYFKFVWNFVGKTHGEREKSKREAGREKEEKEKGREYVVQWVERWKGCERSWQRRNVINIYLMHFKGIG